jgi:hypothetical protein
VLPVRRYIRARLVQVQMLVNVINPRQRYEMMIEDVQRAIS